MVLSLNFLLLYILKENKYDVKEIKGEVIFVIANKLIRIKADYLQYLTITHCSESEARDDVILKHPPVFYMY